MNLKANRDKGIKNYGLFSFFSTSKIFDLTVFVSFSLGWFVMLGLWCIMYGVKLCFTFVFDNPLCLNFRLNINIYLSTNNQSV